MPPFCSSADAPKGRRGAGAGAPKDVPPAAAAKALVAGIAPKPPKPEVAAAAPELGVAEAPNVPKPLEAKEVVDG